MYTQQHISQRRHHHAQSASSQHHSWLPPWLTACAIKWKLTKSSLILLLILGTAVSVRQRYHQSQSLSRSLDEIMKKNYAAAQHPLEVGDHVVVAVADTADTTDTPHPHHEPPKPKGVFILKVNQLAGAMRTVCSLNRFFNSAPQHRYPIRIFADADYSNETMHQLRQISEGVDVQVIVDKEQWHQLPETLTEDERAEVLKRCQKFTNPLEARCTEKNIRIGYVYMGYWRYAKMPYEPSLQEFDYFVSMDGDTYLTHYNMTDPFRLMQQNDLNGIFNIEAYQALLHKGIQTASEAVVPQVEQRKNRYLDSPKYEIFDNNGQYSEYRFYPSIWGCFYGGRLDFFRTNEFREFARRMAPYTYMYRTDEQAVIAAAWSLFGDGEKVWYLPKRGIRMGVYHHSWVDDRNFFKPRSDGNQTTTNATYSYMELDVWKGFHEVRDGLIPWNEYVENMHGPSKDLETCMATTTKA